MNVEQMRSILDYETVAYDESRNALVIIDQTKLPGNIELVSLTTAQEIWDAIYLLKVRGAPAIGVAAAIGLAVLACQDGTKDVQEFRTNLERHKEYLNSSRPTAVNLSWALNRMMQLCYSYEGDSVQALQEKLVQEALKMKQEDIAVCRKIGEYGLSLLQPGDGILTHCNAGQLATCKYGTATAPIYLGQERGYGFRVYADETRPLLQGARLTAFELYSAGVDVTLLCDRVAANGDTANKIGTAVVAAVAKQYQVPFYVCAPTSTIDFATPTGAEIIIEQRKPEEVSHMWYTNPMTAEGVKIYNPAFDVTDHELITGFITEKGVVRRPEELR